MTPLPRHEDCAPAPGPTGLPDAPVERASGGATSSAISPQSSLSWLTLVASGLALYVCWPLWPALVLAAWTAGLARPLLLRFERGLKGRRRAAAMLSLLLFLLLAAPLALVTLGAVGGAQELAQTVAASASAKSALETIATTPAEPWSLPGGAELLELIKRYGSQGLDVVTKLAGVAATGLVALFIYFAGAYTFLVEGRVLWEWVERHAPFELAHLRRFSAAFHETGRGLLAGVGLTVLTQGLVATVIYLSLGVPRAWVLGPVTGLAAVVPVLGSGLVWAPIALGFGLTGHPIKAALLVVLGVGVIGSVDNLLRPIYARLGALKMPTFLLFVSAFGGLATFGPWGALLGPLVVRLTMEALVLRREGPSKYRQVLLERRASTPAEIPRGDMERTTAPGD